MRWYTYSWYPLFLPYTLHTAISMMKNQKCKFDLIPSPPRSLFLMWRRPTYLSFHANFLLLPYMKLTLHSTLLPHSHLVSPPILMPFLSLRHSFPSIVIPLWYQSRVITRYHDTLTSYLSFLSFLKLWKPCLIGFYLCGSYGLGNNMCSNDCLISKQY